MLIEVDSSQPGSQSHAHDSVSLGPLPAGLGCEGDKMPVDYASYLLSASPPGFDLNLHYSLRDHFGEEGCGGTAAGLAQRRNGPPRSIMLNKLLAEEREREMSSLADDLSALELPEKCHCSLDHTGLGGETEASTSVTRSKHSDDRKLGAKKVSFADELGLSLVAVRILTESTDTPPMLRPEIISSLTQGASAGVTEIPPLVLNFSQPASDYMAFRENVLENGVSLENVILKDYSLLGTIKVKNVAFEKHVFVRCTFDDWKTTTDIPASYVPDKVQASRSPYDTFSFEIGVPPTMNVHNKVHFAVCYESGGQQFWDNNGGSNYEVVSADWKAQKLNQEAVDGCTGGPRSALCTAEDFKEWSEFSAWRRVDQEVPYW